jgi:hypothetical protein
MKRQEANNQVKRLNVGDVKNRRQFLKNAAKKAAIPAIAIYSVHKTATPALGFTPI